MPEAEEFREVTGEVISTIAAETNRTRFELLRRRSGGNVDWRFRQSRPSMFWYRTGVEGMHLKIDGAAHHVKMTSACDFGIFPAGMTAEASFDTATDSEYAVVFFDPEFVLSTLGRALDTPLIGFGQEALRHGMRWLCREATQADSTFDLFLEGWSLQALAIIGRMTATDAPRQRYAKGGLSNRTLARVKDYMAHRLGSTILVAELAAVAHCSPRHFLRAFQESTGTSPLRYVQDLRTEWAKQLLADSTQSVTDIALQCGFSHAQHFTTSFRRATGMTPTAFRHLCH